MNDFFKTIINKIPPLPESVKQIEALAKNPDVTYKEVAKLLEKDPLLTAEILKAANSPIYGFSREINTLESAISLFGIGTIRGFVLTVFVRENFDFTLEPYALSSMQFLATASKRHALATAWYLKSEPRRMEILSPATFLSNLGQLLITQHLLHHNNAAAFKDALQNGTELIDAEQQFTQTNTAILSAAVFDHWSFEDALVCTLRYMHDPLGAPERDIKTAQILQCIHTAIPYKGIITEENIAQAKKLAEEYGLDTQRFAAALGNLS
jgi:HD-like signal output (HDOD) protein